MNINEKRLEDIIDEISMGPFGSNIKVDNFVSHGIPVLNGSNLSKIRISEEKFNYITETKANTLGRANASRGDVVITHRGTLGQVSYIPYNSKYDRYVVSQSQLRIRCNNKYLLPEYLAYYFHSPFGRWQLLSNTSQVGVPALARPTSTLKTLFIQLPPLSDQRAIIRILSSLDDKIELNNRMNKTLEEITQTIFKRWFVDFEFPDENGNQYKSSGGKMVESDLGPIPEGWKVTSYSEVMEINTGKRPDIKEPVVDKSKGIVIPIVGANGITSYTNKFLYDEPVIITGRVGTIGTINKWNQKIWPSDNSLVVRCDHFNFCYQLFCCTDFKKITKGSTQPLITQGDLARVQFVLPAKKLIDKFEFIFYNNSQYSFDLSDQTSILTQLRDTLLPKLMSGEIRVPISED